MRITFLGNFQVDYTSETHHKKSLEALGHEVIPFQENQSNGREVHESALSSDLFVVVHTHGWRTPVMPQHEILQRLKGKVPTLTYHLDLWFGLDRQKDLENDPFYKAIDHFFCTDKLMADWFNENTDVKGHFIPAGVYHEECVMLEPQEVDYDVIFVGSKRYHPEWQYRPKLIDWLRAEYGSRFLHVGGDGDTGTVRGLPLNQIYANAKVAVGDTLCINYEYPYYFSDRLFESTGRGGVCIFPHITGIDSYFDIGQEIDTYRFNDFGELKTKIDKYIENESIREGMRVAGFNRTKKDHTYIERWKEILRYVENS